MVTANQSQGLWISLIYRLYVLSVVRVVGKTKQGAKGTNRHREKAHQSTGENNRRHRETGRRKS